MSKAKKKYVARTYNRPVYLFLSFLRLKTYKKYSGTLKMKVIDCQLFTIVRLRHCTIEKEFFNCWKLILIILHTIFSFSIMYSIYILIKLVDIIFYKAAMQCIIEPQGPLLIL